MNALTNSNAFGQWTNKEGKNVFQTDMPLELQKGFTKKRIDHRHHALDALIIACATRNHINYLNNESAKAKNAGSRHELKNLLCEKKYNGDNNKNYKWIFRKPWETFTQDTLDALLSTVVSFKQNTRIINKTVNKYQSWKDEDGNVRLDKNGNPLKEMTKQVKGDSWAIRKPLHAPLPYGKKEYDYAVLKICENVGKRDLIHDPEIKNEVIRVFNENNGKVGLTEKALKGKPIKDNNGEDVLVTVFDTNEIRYRKRQPIYKLANRGQGGFKDAKQAIAFINKVSDKILRHDLLTHLKQHENDIDKAFSTDGIDAFNAKRVIPVYKLPISEASELKFPLGTKQNTKHKYGEAESGTNLFFAVYWNEDSRKRTYDTIPLNIVIEHQKQVAHLPKEQRTPVPLNHEKGQFLFALSPGELVYVPTTEEMVNPRLVDFKQLTPEQAGRVYKMVSSTGTECYLIASCISSLVKNYDAKSKIGEYGSMNKMEKTIDGITIKDRCWKLQVDRLGNIVSATILTH